jgi:glutathione S-transferase
MKLTYFPVRGRVEPARLLLALAGAPYQFEAVPVETWRGPEGKDRFLSRTPFGQLPLLEDGATVLCQSGAIVRYLARKLGLYGGTLEESARVDEVYETAYDTWFEASMACWNPQFHEKRDELRAATRARYERLEAYFLRTRADALHWILPGRHTLGDAMMAHAIEYAMAQHPGLLAELPALHAAVTAFFATEGVRQYVRGPDRPRTSTVHRATFGGKPEETHHWTD